MWLQCMTAVHDCGFELVDHPPLYSPDLAPSDFVLFPNMENPPLGLGSSIGPMIRSYRGPGRELLYHGNPSAATPIEEVCGPRGGGGGGGGRLCLKNKPHLVKFDTDALVPLV